ncbi:hypothetical protein BDW69DRAFT_180953 [Aspergillus filifer]
MKRMKLYASHLYASLFFLQHHASPYDIMNRIRPLSTLLPRILSRQYATPLNHLPQTQHKITVQGPQAESQNPSNHRETLLTQLKIIPRNASNLSITGDTPSDTEWDILSAHFTAVRALEMFTGWNEF